MADVLNRTTRQLIRSANTPDYPVADWIIGPDLRAVAGQPERYWVVTGDAVSLMDAAARAAVDAAALEARRDAVAAEMDGRENYARAFALVVLDEINALRALHGLNARTVAQLKAALRAKLGA